VNRRFSKIPSQVAGTVRGNILAVTSSKLVRRTLYRVGSAFYLLRHQIEIGAASTKLVSDLPAYRPVFHPWDLPEAEVALRKTDPRSVNSPDRKYVLLQLLRQAVNSCPGDIAECGVYKGGTAYLLAQTLEKTAAERRLYLVDSFAGMPETKAGLDAHQEGQFADTSLESVRQYLSPFGNVTYVPGFIPEVLSAVPRHAYCFVHIDLDLHDAIYRSTEYFYPLLQRGGSFLYDDYGFASCAGARAAVDAFFRDKPEEPLVLPTGQCIVIKI
jgi:O-methyltransferase